MRYLGLQMMVVLGWLCTPTAWAAEFQVFPLFTDYGILQQDTAAPIWGTAAAGAMVTVGFRGATATATADQDGKWLARLKTPKAEAGQQGTDLVITSGDKKITLQDVVVGEVWLGSGQSNMDSSLGGYPIGKAEAPRANIPDLRIYTGAGWAHRGDYSKYKWSRCTPEVAGKTSATGYFFSKELQAALQVPVGFVMMAYSGSSLSPWLEASWLQADPRTAAPYEKWLKEELPKAVAKRKDALAKWEKEVSEATVRGEKQLPKRPFEGPAEVGPEEWVGKYFRTHIQPVMPFAFRGLLWDQGEGGTGINAGPYDVMFEVMVQNWRKGFGRNLPVIYCQMPKGGGWGPLAWIVGKNQELGDPVPLADLPAAVPGPGKVFEGFAKEADPFARMQAQDQCWMAVTRDLCVAVHPPDKDHYAHRFFLTAWGQVYGRKGEWFGPLMKEAKRDGDKVRISFEHVGSGLEAPGGKSLQGFVLTGKEAGGKTKSVWAKGVIEGDSVVLTGDGLESYDLVSYAPGGRVLWANLFNKEGLPAYPMTLNVK